MTSRILIVGATGRLGRQFTRVLSTDLHEVRALIRAEPSSAERDEVLEQLEASGVQLVEGSLEDEQSLERACEGVTEIVSCVDHRPDHLLQQAALARAAGKAGSVRRLIPSQFGIDSRLYGEARVDHGDAKRAVQKELANSGIPITYIHTNGLAAEWVGSLGQLGLREPPQGQVEVYGEGDVRFSTVAVEDVARFGARALFDPAAAGRHLLIAPPDNLLTQVELIEAWEKKSGTSLERQTISREALDERIARLAADPASRPALAMAQLVRAAWLDGLGDGRRLPDVLDAVEAYPDIEYVRAIDYLDRYR